MWLCCRLQLVGLAMRFRTSSELLTDPLPRHAALLQNYTCLGRIRKEAQDARGVIADICFVERLLRVRWVGSARRNCEKGYLLPMPGQQVSEVHCPYAAQS